jgi:hypothetical protein
MCILLFSLFFSILMFFQQQKTEIGTSLGEDSANNIHDGDSSIGWQGRLYQGHMMRCVLDQHNVCSTIHVAKKEQAGCMAKPLVGSANLLVT